ncbi:MAG: hypothetical protein IKA75_07220 [Bacteroidaceae bacterium]|nr:hypothetical protein [Bacteroidaceae bacterium]
MKKNFLLPPICKRIGWAMLIPSLVLYVLTLGDVIDDYLLRFPTLCISADSYHTQSSGITWEPQGMFMELCLALVVIAFLFISFAREKDEDEMITALRFQSFAWAFRINAVLLIIGTWTIFGGLYLHFILFCLFSIFVLYIGKFEYELYQLKHLSHEE